MNQVSVLELSRRARLAVSQRHWAAVETAANSILRIDEHSAEGWFLSGLYQQSQRQLGAAMHAFEYAWQLAPERYDAAIELAGLKRQQLHHAEAVQILQQVGPLCHQSSLYSHKAAQIYTRLGLHESANPFYRRAVAIQPDAASLKASLATNTTLLGNIDEARLLLNDLLHRYPKHQRHHWELAALRSAQDDHHLRQMQQLLEASDEPDERNIFLLYAIGKESEDLERWESAFDCYQRAGAAAVRLASASGYQIGQDTAPLDALPSLCSRDWCAQHVTSSASKDNELTPIFVVGLPRTGTTLVERILSSHSNVDSADETFFLPIALRQAIQSTDYTNPDLTVADLTRVAETSLREVAKTYSDLVRYRLDGAQYFVDKYPLNFKNLGFICAAFPNAKIVLLDRHPMDACFALFKQPYFNFAYRLDHLADYYLAYDRLRRHWLASLGERITSVNYEALVTEPQREIARLLDKLELPIEQACFDFHTNQSASATASSVQVREAMHRRSVQKWVNWERQLAPLSASLLAAGVSV
ncbi:tetratricopeptide repeat-containing sulfotransferase family protein [Arenicella chitinivorans]|uniref:tetratricopeptide repeat-containing sulfotransferase family protein n=1 Tax=Arenicella chitinivorans TaxID=1329800 RepID=UPI0016729101|nr:sulfotransferase [Arenicella chitinivorans]